MMDMHMLTALITQWPGEFYRVSASRELEVRGHLVQSVVEMGGQNAALSLPVLFVRRAGQLQGVCCSY